MMTEENDKPEFLFDTFEASINELDVEPTYDKPVQLEGHYEVDPVPGSKRFQGVWLVLDDNSRYLLAYRPIPEYADFVGKRVVVNGRPYTPGSDTQHIQAKHLRIDTIELTPSETK